MLLKSFSLVAAFLPLGLAGVARPSIERRAGADKPGLAFDKNTTPHCTWWLDNDGSEECKEIPEFWSITMADFLRWNPSITPGCGNFKSGTSYCVEAAGEPPVSKPDPSKPEPSKPEPSKPEPSKPEPSKPIVTPPPVSVSVPATTSSSTKPSNGIETPQPTQPDIVSNCNKFHFVKRGEGCALVASKNGITLAQFQEWNPSAGKECTGLWADSYACVSVIGNKPSPTKPDNGIKTPSPTQPEIVKDCKKFHFVKSGQTCADIASDNGISLGDFLAWNPKAGAGCSGLWANAYACISVIGYENFDDGNMDGWTVYDGSYDAGSHKLVGDKSSGGKALLNAQYADFVFEADISFPDGFSGNAGLVFRASDAGKGADAYRGYYAGITGSGSVVLGRADNDWTEIDSTRSGAVCCRNYHIKVRASGDSITVWVDDMNRPLIQVRDGTFRSGMNGVRVYQTGASFDNIKISPAAADDFDDGDMAGWTVYDGNFDAGSRALVSGNSFTGKALLNDYFTDFTFEADIDFPHPERGNAGLIFRISNAGKGADSYTGYYAGIGIDGAITLGRANDDWTEIKRVEANIRPGSHHMMVRANGDALSIYVDDMNSPKIDVKDDTYSGGMNGVRYYQTDATYDNIRILRL